MTPRCWPSHRLTPTVFTKPRPFATLSNPDRRYDGDGTRGCVTSERGGVARRVGGVGYFFSGTPYGSCSVASPKPSLSRSARTLDRSPTTDTTIRPDGISAFAMVLTSFAVTLRTLSA